MSRLTLAAADYPGTWAPDIADAPGTSLGTALEFAAVEGAGAGRVGITVDHPADVLGNLPDFVGQTIFERIHVILSGHQVGQWGFEDLGPVLSGVELPVEVWNAYRRTVETLDTIGVTTAGGFTVEGEGIGLGVLFQPLQSRLYDIAIDLDGPPSLDDLALFDFGLGSAPANVQGVRLVPFPFRLSWPMTERYAYLTDISTAGDGTEQRRRLRTLPRRGMAGTVVLGDADEAVTLHALLFGWNAQQYGVPLWWDVSQLTAAVLVGAVIIPVSDTTQRDLLPGRIALLWQAHNQWEAVVIASVDSSTQVTVKSPIRKDWTPQRTLLLPIRLGRLASNVPFTRDGRHVSSMDVSFELEGAG